MYNEGDITRPGDFVDPTSGRLSQLFRKVTNLITRPATPDIMAEECVVVTALLKVIISYSFIYFIKAFLVLVSFVLVCVWHTFFICN